MLNSRTKDKIYALLSFLSIILTIGSFVAVVSFLVNTNKYIFSVDEKIVKEKTTVVDKAGYETIEEKLNSKKIINSAELQPEITPQEIPVENTEAALDESLQEGVLSDIAESSPSPSPAPSSSPNTKSKAKNSY